MINLNCTENKRKKSFKYKCYLFHKSTVCILGSILLGRFEIMGRFLFLPVGECSCSRGNCFGSVRGGDTILVTGIDISSNRVNTVPVCCCTLVLYCVRGGYNPSDRNWHFLNRVNTVPVCCTEDLMYYTVVPLTVPVCNKLPADLMRDFCTLYCSNSMSLRCAVQVKVPKCAVQSPMP